MWRPLARRAPLPSPHCCAGLPASLLVDAEWSLLASLQWRLLSAAQEVRAGGLCSVPVLPGASMPRGVQTAGLALPSPSFTLQVGLAAPAQEAEEQEEECASWEQQHLCVATADALTAGVFAALAQLEAPAQPQPQPQDPGLLAAMLRTQPHALEVRRAARAASLRNLLAAGEPCQPEATGQPAPLLPAVCPQDWAGPVAGGLFWASSEAERGQGQGEAEASPRCLAGLLEALCAEHELE